MRSASDDELLVSTDPEAFGAFYGRHAGNVQRYFAWRTGDRELAADLTSETFAAALLARRRFTPGGAPAEAWLYMIAARRLVDHRRRSAGEQRMRDGLLGDIDEAREDERIADLLRDGVSLAMLNQLPAEQRAAVGAHVLVGSGYQELSEQAGISQAGARQRVSRGLAALRATMRAYRAADELAGQSRPVRARRRSPRTARFAARARCARLLLLQQSRAQARRPLRAGVRMDVGATRRLGRSRRRPLPHRVGQRRARLARFPAR